LNETASDSEAVEVGLPRSLRLDRSSVRAALFQRLAGSRLFALGDRAGVLRTAERRSGRSFRLDVHQRVVVKGLVSRHLGRGLARTGALTAHLAYLGRSGAGPEGARPTFFSALEDGLDPSDLTDSWTNDRHHFRFIISPEHGDRLADLRDYVREVMRRVSADLGEPGLGWIGVCHFDTDQPHAHVLVRGRRGDGRDLVIPRHYMGYGFRARAQEVAQERLGDLSRAEAERRVWREVEADRFTGFDRRLLQASDEAFLVDDGVGRGEAWAALTRGRLRHLERLGLAQRTGARYRLDAQLELKLRGLQIRTDVLRTLNQRRLEGARAVKELGGDRVRGRVVRSGSHDELGASPFVVVRDTDGIEHYARLGFGRTPPRVGARVELLPSDRGVLVLGQGRGAPEIAQ